MNFKNKKILITGSTDGLGFNLALQLQKLGAKLIIHGRNKKKVNEVAKKISKNTQNYIQKYICDFNDTENTKESFKSLIKKVKKIDLVFFCHASNIYGPYEKVNLENSLNVLNCNFISISIMSSLLLKSMKKNSHGIIVYILSGTSLFPLPKFSMYSASKAALYSLGKALQIENEKSNINIHLIFPGKINTCFDKKTLIYDNNTSLTGTKLKGRSPKIIAEKIISEIINNNRTTIMSKSPFYLSILSFFIPNIINKLIFKKFCNN